LHVHVARKPNSRAGRFSLYDCVKEFLPLLRFRLSVPRSNGLLMPHLAVALAAVLLGGCDAYDASLLPARETLRDVGSSDGGAVGPNECTGTAARCTRPNADTACVDGACALIRCRAPFVDCDGDSANGCEATLDSVEHCGACGASCARTNVAAPRCDLEAEDGPCVIERSCTPGATLCLPDDPSHGCAPGYADCDGRAANGCETSLRALSDCGGCGVVCSSADSDVSCETGQCVALGCAPGFGDCHDDGCASLASNAQHCGECDEACTEGTACHGGRCTALSCAAGTADCDGEAENGCEASLDDLWTCGVCDVQCGPYARARAGCDAGRCTIAACDAGFGDCDRVLGNGCEADLRQPEHCGACGKDCSALPHVVAAECVAGECSRFTCEPGWGDCDGDSENGCEQSLVTAAHCGACGQACALDHATADCSTGSCLVSACHDGFDDCNGLPQDGCEAALDSDAHCGGCGAACGAGNACQGGGCACVTDESCSGGRECCDGACIDTKSKCYPWPCIPGTKRDENNCGGCGVTCAFCCAA
jgi:hypothetical protein